ncbi:MAG: hypothetical protein AB8C02_15075 [Halioglobus sp.]
MPNQITDNTPILVGAGQSVDRLTDNAQPPFSSPIALASAASRHVLNETGIPAQALDTIAVIRTFADAAPAWQAPLGSSNNPPESVARRLGAEPSHRIYSNAGGTEPMALLAEMCQEIARGAKRAVLLTGAEAIANERYAKRHDLKDDWHERFDAPLDAREYKARFASAQEIRSGMFLPAHYYALIENAQADALNHTLSEHQRYMGEMFAPFSDVAAANPLSQNPKAFTAEELALPTTRNYPISLPYTKWLIAQDAVNQGAALVVTSVGYARELGIDPARWIFLRGYAAGMDIPLSQRADPGTSATMKSVLNAALDRGECKIADVDMIDIYSCFPCAVHAACDALKLPTDGSIPLTVTGGLPYFGGPGNNYTMHALAEMVDRLQADSKQKTALVTGNGGILSKHAALLLTNNPQTTQHIDWLGDAPKALDATARSAVPYADNPTRGEVISYTVIVGRNAPDTSVVLAKTAAGERFLATSKDEAVASSLRLHSPVGRQIGVTTEDEAHTFSLAAH